MSVYVDSISTYPGEMIAEAAKRHGVRWSHMWCDAGDEAQLHDIAARIGLKRSWFQEEKKLPHYDVVPSKRTLAIRCGAVEKSLRDWLRERRQQTTSAQALRNESGI